MDIESDVPTGVEFSQELKQLMFNVIQFVENEKSGTIIPLNNVNDRLQAMLGISLSSVRRLKEMRQDEGRLIEERQLIEGERQRKENQRVELTNRLRQRRSISRESACFTTS